MKRFSDLQGIAFDVGGTLIDPWPSVGHVYAEVAAEHGFPKLDPRTLNRSFGEAWRQKTDFDYSRESWLKLVNHTFQPIEELSEGIPFFSELYDRFSHPQAWRIYDDVVPTLEWLRGKGFVLAVISNWDDRLRQLLERLQLDRYFKVLVISAEIGMQKPSRKVFKTAIDQLGIPSEATLHIGDSPVEDLDGAVQASLKALLIKRDRSAGNNGCITSLNELKNIIETKRFSSCSHS